MAGSIKVAIIGLDTSHAIEFPRIMQGDAPVKARGIKAVTCLRFPSPFQTEEQQDGRQKILEGWGVKVTRNFAEAVNGVDAFMLEINDPAQHLKYFRKVAELGKPVFIDKPLAKNLADGRKIVKLAAEKKVKAWEASSLRFSPEMAAVLEEAGAVELCNIYGALGQAPAGSSLVWYGCHTFEMLHQVMGGGARRVHALEGSRGIVTVVEYDDGRRGVVESITGNWHYGGRVHGAKGLSAFQVNSSGLYNILLEKIRGFLAGGLAPVPLSASLEAQAVMEAAGKSLQSGKPEKV